MSKAKKKYWLICYDISNPKRLQKLNRLLKKQALAWQYSIFVANMTGQQIDSLMQQISLIINLKKDDVRCYPIQTQGQHIVMGAFQLPQGIQLIDSQNAVLQTLFNNEQNA